MENYKWPEDRKEFFEYLRNLTPIDKSWNDYRLHNKLIMEINSLEKEINMLKKET